MANRFEFRVHVTCNRVEGKFASREELAEKIQDALETADLTQIACDNGGQYETEWEVEEIEPVKKTKKKNVFKNNTFGGTPIPVDRNHPDKEPLIEHLGFPSRQGKQQRTIGGRLR